MQTKKRELDATIAGIVIQFREAEEDINAAIRSDELTIRVIKNNIRAREFRMRQEKARVEREQRAEFLRWQQAEQERRDREAMKAWEKDQAAIRVARKQKDRAWQASLEKQRVEQEMRARILREQQEEQQRRSRQAADARLVAEYQRQAVAHVAQRQRQEDFNSQHPGSRTFQSLFCLHGCSFRELLGYAVCPRCQDVWDYPLECPTCPTQACPKCQSIQPRSTTTPYRYYPKTKTPSSDSLRELGILLGLVR